MSFFSSLFRRKKFATFTKEKEKVTNPEEMIITKRDFKGLSRLGVSPKLFARTLRVGLEYFKEIKSPSYIETYINKYGGINIRILFALLHYKSVHKEDIEGALPVCLALIIHHLSQAETMKGHLVYLAKSMLITGPSRLADKVAEYGDLFKKFGLELVVIAKDNLQNIRELEEHFCQNFDKVVVMDINTLDDLWNLKHEEDQQYGRHLINNVNLVVYDEIDEVAQHLLYSENTHLKELSNMKMGRRAIGFVKTQIGVKVLSKFEIGHGLVEFEVVSNAH